MTRNVIGLLIALSVFANTSRAADAPTIDEVKKAWQKRQNAHKAFRIEWVETVTVKAGGYDHFETENPGPHPPKDTEHKATCSFAIDGDKVAMADERMLYAPGTQTWIPYATSTSFDGQTWRSVQPLHGRGWPPVQIETGFARNRGAVQSGINQPSWMVHRPLASKPSFDFARFKLAGRTSKIGPVECVELVPTDAAKKDARPGYDHALWCDPDRDFLPIREKKRSAIGGSDVDYAYRKDGKGGWALSGWTIERLDPKGGVEHTSKAEVKKLDLDPKFAADAFAPKPPAPSHVAVYADAVKTEEYLIRADGSKRIIPADEPSRDYTELAKTNADGTPYAPAKK